MFKKLIPLIIATFFILPVNAQTLTPEEYIEQYKDFAIREMKRMGVPAAITLAQGLLETENGNSPLLKKSNNHFGIKCKSNWTAGGVSHDDDAPGECFRTYKDAQDSYRDHSNFLRGNDRYAFLFALNPTDYKGWAQGLKKAGYATNPKYPAILIKNIERYNLQKYSLIAANNVPNFETSKYEDKEVVSPMVNSGPVINIYPEDTNNEKIDPGQSLQINFINGHKCINAQKGTSLLAIATQHNINLRKLLDFNDLEADGILEADQVIFLQRKPTKGATDFYMVQQKETLYDVAQNNGIQLQAMLDYNQLNEDGDVYPGTKLYLKAVAESDQANIIRHNVHDRNLYEVKPKEGLYSVAKKHGVSVQQLRDWNKLKSDELKVGQQLIVGQ